MSTKDGLTEAALGTLVDERIAKAAAEERERRLQADQRLSEAVARIEEAYAEASDAKERLSSAKDEMARGQSQIEEVRATAEDIGSQLMAVRVTAETSQAEAANLRDQLVASEREAKKYKQRFSTLRKGAVCISVGLVLAFIWLWGVEDLVIRGTELNAVAISILLIAMALMVWFWSRRAIRNGIVLAIGLILAAMSVGPWHRRVRPAASREPLTERVSAERGIDAAVHSSE